VRLDPLDARPGQTARALGLPGEPPFLRGIHPTMYLGRPWTIRPVRRFFDREGHQRAVPPSCSPNGQTGLSTAFDLPDRNRQLDPRRRPLLGWGGRQSRRLAIATLDDMLELFVGRAWSASVSTSMTINATAIGPSRALCGGRDVGHGVLEKEHLVGKLFKTTS
jgi:methylmalonyl-CoA mutase N-terminal domain/subunit